MGVSELPNGKQSTKASISRQTALFLAPFAWFVVIPLAHGVVPWAISLLAPHHGWAMGRPGIWNWLGLVPILAGVAGLIWIFVLGFAKAAELPERIELDWSPKLLLMRGPYSFTRNPMYIAELALWFGWTVLFGSVANLIAFLVLCAVINFVVRREERDLERQFGETYCQYKAAVPRWLGRIQH